MLWNRFFKIFTELSLARFRFDADSKHVFVGDYGGSISVIKLESNSPSLVTTLNGHSGKLPPWQSWFGAGDLAGVLCYCELVTSLVHLHEEITRNIGCKKLLTPLPLNP